MFTPAIQPIFQGRHSCIEISDSVLREFANKPAPTKEREDEFFDMPTLMPTHDWRSAMNHG